MEQVDVFVCAAVLVAGTLWHRYPLMCNMQTFRVHAMVAAGCEETEIIQRSAFERRRVHLGRPYGFGFCGRVYHRTTASVREIHLMSRRVLVVVFAGCLCSTPALCRHLDRHRGGSDKKGNAGVFATAGRVSAELSCVGASACELQR